MRIACIAAAALLGVAQIAAAQPAKPAEAKSVKPLSIEDVWKRPAIAEPLLSPRDQANRSQREVLAMVADRRAVRAG